MPDWLFSRFLQQSVRVIERVELWGQTQVRVWASAQNEVLLLPESDLAPSDGTDPHAVDRLLVAIAAARIREALAGETLAAPLDASVIPLPHHLRALARATLHDRMRYLLADEVGLGKTIEAGLILRVLKLRGQVKRVLIIAPKGLVLQWVAEMRTRFHETFRLIEPDDLIELERMPWEVNPWERFDQIIVMMDAVKPVAQVEQLSLFVSDEKGAMQRLRAQLESERQTYQDLQPKFLQELHQARYEKMPELHQVLEENFLKDDEDRWYMPDPVRAEDLEQLRERGLLKEFAAYLDTKGKLKQFRTEAVRAGFKVARAKREYPDDTGHRASAAGGCAAERFGAADVF